MKNLPIGKNYHEPKQTAVTAIALFYMRLLCSYHCLLPIASFSAGLYPSSRIAERFRQVLRLPSAKWRELVAMGG
jgi:hypothetical protein